MSADSLFYTYSDIPELLLYSDGFFRLLDDLSIDQNNDLIFYTWLFTNVFAPRSVMTLTPKDFATAFSNLQVTTIDEFKSAVTNLKSTLTQKVGQNDDVIDQNSPGEEPFSIPTTCPYCNNNIQGIEVLHHVYFRNCKNEKAQCNKCLEMVTTSNKHCCQPEIPSFSCPSCSLLTSFDQKGLSHVIDCGSRDEFELIRLIELVSGVDGVMQLSNLIDNLTGNLIERVRQFCLLFIMFKLTKFSGQNCQNFSELNGELFELLKKNFVDQGAEFNIETTKLKLNDKEHCFIKFLHSEGEILIDLYFCLNYLTSSASLFHLNNVDFDHFFNFKNDLLGVHFYNSEKLELPLIIPSINQENAFQSEFCCKQFENDDGTLTFTFKILTELENIESKILSDPISFRTGVIEVDDSKFGKTFDVVIITSIEYLTHEDNVSPLLVEISNGNQGRLAVVRLPLLF
ncbi:hypothetical protein P9112_009576 [Eukaryota sp. TZLM1-RC]